MLLKVRNLLNYVPVRTKRSMDWTRFPEAIGPYGQFMPGPYPKPPSLEERMKIPRSLRYRMKTPVYTILDRTPYKHLPDEYRKFYIEWKLTLPKNVHYDIKEGRFEKNPLNGEVTPIQNVPLPLIDTPFDNGMMLGGEATIQCYYHLFKGKRQQHDIGVLPRFWFPKFRRTIIYSEILNKHMSAIVTRRTIMLINDHNGLDNYLLETRACDLRNNLPVKLKRKLLLILLNKSQNPESDELSDELFSRYKHFLDAYTPEEIEWYGLTLKEASVKYGANKIRQKEANPPVPLKHELRKEFLDYLKYEKPLEPLPEPWYKKKLISFK